MEKRGISEVLEKITREGSHSVNLLGGEITQVGRAIGDEEASASLNIASTSAVVALGAVAGGAAIVSARADKKSKKFYGKLDSYGGLGVPMDDNCKVLTTTTFGNADLVREKGKSLPSVEVLSKHIAHEQDTAIQRSFEYGADVWTVFLFSKQLVKNRVAFGIGGNYPPRIELSLADFDMNSLDPDLLRSLVDDLGKKGASLTASGASDRFGECNLTANFGGFNEALKVLNNKKYGSVPELDGLRKKIEEHITNKHLFGFEVPKLELTPDALAGFSAEEIEEIKLVIAKQPEMSVVTRSDGVIELAGTQTGFDRVLNSPPFASRGLDNVISEKHKERYTKLSTQLREFCKSEKMASFTRDFVSLKRELSGFDSIAFNIKNGRCIVQTDHGLEDIVQVLMAANRIPESWDKGIKGQMKEWAKTNQLDSKYSAFFVYGERQGAAAVQRTLYTRVMDEELSASADVAKDQLLFWEKNEAGVEHCTVTHLRGAELDRVVADRTRDYQALSLEKSDALISAITSQQSSSGVQLSDEAAQKIADALLRGRQ